MPKFGYMPYMQYCKSLTKDRRTDYRDIVAVVLRRHPGKKEKMKIAEKKEQGYFWNTYCYSHN
ncbi:MAG: hypothetical protein WAM14_23660 [Candidatus Nitrosopolaris sp.]